ncbi:MAG: FAD-dependent monooxygenase [Proteobacteria bacterium]|nr:FAD-dependent monooxygenase [Pseudomonadota bacterium]
MFDVAVVGGGPVGACAATLLARSGKLRVVLLEPNAVALPSGQSPLDARVVALSRASENILRAAEAWVHVCGPRLEAYERMRIWHEGIAAFGHEALVFDAADVGEPNLGYILENRLLQGALLKAFAAAGGQLEPAALQGLGFGRDAVQVRHAHGTLEARLVLGADGAQSAVRQLAGLGADVADYHQVAIVATVATGQAHQHTAWQRFMRDGTLAFLPLADGTSSIVWSADEPLARARLADADPVFEAALEVAADGALGTMQLKSERQAFPLRRLSAQRYAGERVALLGDAAHVVHPLAGQGVNLGLLDAAAVAERVLEAVGRREDPGALGVLRAYERWRRSEVALMDAAIHGFDRFLSHATGPAGRLARQGMSFVARSQELRRFFVRHALGMSGELPQAAKRA